MKPSKKKPAKKRPAKRGDHPILVLDKLSKIEKACHTENNLVPLIIDAVESYATLEEIVNSMKKVFGEWTEKSII